MTGDGLCPAKLEPPPAGQFRFIERAVSVADEFVRVRAVLRCERHANTDTDHHVALVNLVRRAEMFDDPPGERRGCFGVTVRVEHRELVAAHPSVLPRGIEWLWLAGIAATGLVLFNVALVAGSRHAEPAVLGVAVACVPAVLAVIGPLLEGSRPRAAGVSAALVVTCGAALVQGLGRTDGLGVAWAAVVFGCEAAFTLLAIPVLGRHGPWACRCTPPGSRRSSLP